MPSTGFGVYAAAFLETALAAGFRTDAFLAPAFFATGFFAVFFAAFFFAMRGSLPQQSRIGQCTGSSCKPDQLSPRFGLRPQLERPRPREPATREEIPDAASGSHYWMT